MTVIVSEINAPTRGFGAPPLAMTGPRARKRHWRRRMRSVLGRMGPQWGLIVLLVLAGDVALAALAWGMVRLVAG